MSKSLRTLIEWAHYSLNFWWGCTKVSPACAHCYAEVISKIFSKGQAQWGPDGPRRLLFDSAAAKLAKIVRAAEREGFRPRVFVNSMSDTFEHNAQLTEIRGKALALMEATPQVDFLLLTKRPENVLQMVPDDWRNWHWPSHVWVGTTVENQDCANRRIPELMRVPAKVRFLSCEPLLGPLDLTVGFDGPKAYPLGQGIDWVICGGESGGGARPMQVEWARSLRDQCALWNVPFFFKQWGELAPDFNGVMHRVGKAKAGRQLDHREWNDVPEAAA